MMLPILIHPRMHEDGNLRHGHLEGSSARTGTAGTESRTSTKSSSAVHHLVACLFAAEYVQAVDEVEHAVAVDPVILIHRTPAGGQ